MAHYNDKTYGLMIDFVENISEQINEMYDICPKVFLRFNQENESGGSAIWTYRVSDMYIELDIPHNYTFGKVNRATLACILVHEYCHYIDALAMNGSERVNNMNLYISSARHRRAEEQRNWTATKRLAKKLGLWNKPFYNAVRSCVFTTALQY